jgi:hypothetical protein
MHPIMRTAAAAIATTSSRMVKPCRALTDRLAQNEVSDIFFMAATFS